MDLITGINEWAYRQKKRKHIFIQYFSLNLYLFISSNDNKYEITSQ